MPQPDHISKLGVPDPGLLDDDLQAVWHKCVEKLGFVPNVFSAYSLRPQRLRNFMAMYNEIMLSPSGLSKLEREMVAVVVSSANRCYYCLVAHGAAVRQLSGDPELGEMMALNYRVARVDPRQRAMLDFAWKMTTTPHLIEDADRDVLRAIGLTEEDLFDLAETVAFFNLSNRMASATDMMPNREYHGLVRDAPVLPPPGAQPVARKAQGRRLRGARTPT
ncbi:MAG: peroxidase-related enzyme [Acetobacteraceae bacterium]|nr:peroxidase-related enzyme [Acetobacteraceae bacterium]